MNTSKFFNRKSSIRNPQKPYKKGYVKEESKNYKSRIFSRAKETKTNKTLLSIRSNVFRIENLLRGKDALESKSEKAIQKYKLFELKQEQEKKKKINAQSGGGGGFGLGNLIQRPKTGIMDAISNFLFYTFLGWLFTTLQPLIPKLEALAPILGGAFDFLSGTLKFLMDSIGSFIKFGYDAKDTITKKHEEIKVETEKLKENFDNTLDELKKVIGESIEAVSSFLGITYGEDKVNTTLEQQYAEDLKIPDLPPLPSSSLPLQKPQLNQPNFGPIKGVRTGGIIGYADGGNVEEENESQNKRIDPRKDPITRGIQQEKEKKKLLLFPTQKEALKTNPGADVGGEIYIRNLYGDADTNDSITQIFFQNETANVYPTLIKISEDYKKPDTSKDFIGFNVLLGAVNDVTLGQKPSNKVYEQFASGLNYLIDFAKNDPKTFEKINLEQMVKNAIEPKLLAAISDISTIVSKKAIQDVRSGLFDPSGTGTTPSGSSIDSINIQGFSPEDIDALGKIIAAEAGGESNVGKAAVMAVILNRYRLIKSGTPPSQFAIQNKSKEEVTIRDIIFASAQFSPVSDGRFRRTTSSAGQTALAAAISAGGNNPEKLKQELIKAGLNEYDADHVVRSTFFSNPQDRTSVPAPGQRGVSVGRHSFQQSANVRLTGRIGTIDATVNEIKAVNPGLFKSLTGDSGVSQGSKPLSVPYSPFTSDRGRPKITSGQGWRWGREHKGIDVEADPGTPMYAYLPGTIVFSGDAGGYGYRVEWKDSKGFIHSYSHMQKDPGFRVGQKVNQGQLMGYVGNTGRSTGPHLHWEIQNSSGTHQDVIGWLKSNPLPKPKPETTQPNQPNQPNQPKKTPSFSRLTSKEAQELEMRSVFMKPGDPPIVVEGIGSIQMGKDFFGRPQKKYYNRDGKEITKDQFNELMKKYKNPIRSNTPKKKYGGLVYKPGTSPVLPEEKYASYEDPMERGIVAIQPIYISQPVPVPVGGSGGGGVIAFSLPKVNNMDNYQQLMRG